MHYNSEELILFRGLETDFEGLVKRWKSQTTVNAKCYYHGKKIVPYLCTIPIRPNNQNNSLFISISSGKATTKMNKRQKR